MSEDDPGPDPLCCWVSEDEELCDTLLLLRLEDLCFDLFSASLASSSRSGILLCDLEREELKGVCADEVGVTGDCCEAAAELGLCAWFVNAGAGGGAITCGRDSHELVGARFCARGMMLEAWVV